MTVTTGEPELPAAPPKDVSAARPRTQRVRSRLSATFSTWQARLGLILLVFFVGMAVVGAVLSPESHPTTDLYADPSWDHPFGTDGLGRDVLARTVGGSARIVAVSFAAAVFCVSVAALLAALVAYRGGLVDLASMRAVDVLLSFPTIVSALLAAALLPPGYLSLFLVAAILQIPPVMRVSRGIFANAFAQDYVSAAVLRGESARRVVVGEVLPNVAGVLLVETAIRWSASLLLLAGLNFLGVGVQPPAADWGLMLEENRSTMLVAPWASLAPAIALAGLAVGINFTADGISNALGRRGDYLELAR
jgi:peptide/nickel transport system permease protein